MINIESPEKGGGISLKGRQMWPYLHPEKIFVYIIQMVR